MPVQDSIAQQMLQHISDPRLRETYGNILAGKYVFKVSCINPQKNPDTKKPYHASPCAIGYIDKKGQVIDAVIIDKKTGEPVAGIETSRDRFDGRKGFKCYCGNWSIQCKEEQGVLKAATVPAPPTKEELTEIFERVKGSNKGPLQFVAGVAEYDGFRLEEVTT